MEGAAALEGSGVTKGSGSWGVSTLVENPVTGGPYVMRFGREAEAVDYARDRALKTGIPLRPNEQSGTEKGRVMYVLHFSVDAPDGALVYRVLRGHRGVRQEKGASVPGTTQEQVLVFRNGGDLPGDKIRWVLDKGLTLDVEDTEVAREKAKYARGSKGMSREERYGHRDDLIGSRESQLVELLDIKAHLESRYMRTKLPRILKEIEEVEKRIAVLERAV